ncbi:MAG: hypothetical protein HY887_03990 [Deltaproteobacteria bacterium]|nr:hypothetical protein [Deltaproteobacteria bacterium]
MSETGMPDMHGRKAAIDLFLISFLSLFAEMTFLRYIPSNIYLLSYYKNAILIAVFLGLGIGFMLSKAKTNSIEYLPVATLVILCIVIYFNDYLRIDLDYSRLDASIWGEFWANTKARGVPMFWVLIAFYIMTALYFIPLGQETGRAMSRFIPLKAYSLNVAGSLAGVVSFAAAGWLWTKPVVWFAVVLSLLLKWSYAYSERRVFALNAASAVIALFVVFSANMGLEVWSPYSRVRVYPFNGSFDYGFISTTNGNPQVGSINFDAEYKGPEGPLNRESRMIYEIPYTRFKPESVLIAGAGAGNEVVTALRSGASSVSAVEIDPAFVSISSALSPHKPFTDSRVKVFVDDARAHFHKTRSKYDLIVIGFLDSQYHLTHMSNIRTENFVYTVESFGRIKEILTERGILQLNYNAPKAEMRLKLFRMLRDVFGHDLIVLAPSKPVSGNISYLAGPGVKGWRPELPGIAAVSFSEEDTGLENATDNWPFLYIDAKKLPREYWSMLLAIPLISIVMIKGLGRAAAGFSPKYFLLGFGFMLLETKSITSLALLFGSTVTVVSVVIASILSAILAANYITVRIALRGLKAPYILIFLSLVGLYFLPLEYFTGLNWTAKLAASMLLISAPLFFAAIVFAVSFSKSARMDVDFGSNIFGAVVGGLGEYISMSTGFQGLYILSLIAYIAAFAIDMKNRERV